MLILTRQELYQRVWQTPASKLAKELGVSDVMIAKLCRKHKIPKPPLGYWAKLQHGKKVTKPPLPKTDPELDRILIQHFGKPKPSPPVREETKRITIPESLEKVHPLVAKTERHLRKAKPDELGLLRPKAAGCLNITVTRENVERALRIFDALIRAAQTEGPKVHVSEKGDTVATWLGHSVTVRLREPTKRTPHVPTPEEIETKRRWSFSTIPAYDYVPSGQLTIEVNGGYGPYPSVWRDGKVWTLEERVPEVAASLKAYAEDHKRREEERAESDRRWAIRAEQERRERERIEKLEKWLGLWRKARAIRSMLADVEADIVQKGVIPTAESLEYLEWARRYADRIDPAVVKTPIDTSY